jgi:hypothetical protein
LGGILEATEGGMGSSIMVGQWAAGAGVRSWEWGRGVYHPRHRHRLNKGGLLGGPVWNLG